MEIRIGAMWEPKVKPQPWTTVCVTDVFTHEDDTLVRMFTGRGDRRTLTERQFREHYAPCVIVQLVEAK